MTTLQERPSIQDDGAAEVLLEPQPGPGRPLPDYDTQALHTLLPHRWPFLMIDRLIDCVAFERATGIKNVTNSEPWFQGHFPGDPIMPGVLIIECMAQSAAALVCASRGRAGRGDMVYFMSVDEARFRKPVRPGDTLRLEVSKQKQRLGVYRFAGRATVEGDLVAAAVFSAKVMETPGGAGEVVPAQPR